MNAANGSALIPKRSIRLTMIQRTSSPKPKRIRTASSKSEASTVPRSRRCSKKGLSTNPAVGIGTTAPSRPTRTAARKTYKTTTSTANRKIQKPPSARSLSSGSKNASRERRKKNKEKSETLASGTARARRRRERVKLQNRSRCRLFFPTSRRSLVLHLFCVYMFFLLRV